MEQFIKDSVNHVVKDYNFGQHGFTEKRSHPTNLTLLFDYIKSLVAKDKCIDKIFSF